MSRGTAQQMLIFMIDSDTGCKYWYIVIGVTIPFKGPKGGGGSVKNYDIFPF